MHGLRTGSHAFARAHRVRAPAHKSGNPRLAEVVLLLRNRHKEQAMSQNEIEQTFVEETYAVQPLQRSVSPSMDAYEAFDDRDDHPLDERRMFMLDVSAVIVGTIMALGPLSVYSIFGS
jgi:hypothetical protein